MLDLIAKYLVSLACGAGLAVVVFTLAHGQDLVNALNP
jgi:hypothetical protein